MFNKWLTIQEKDDFLTQLQSEGWELVLSQSLKAFSIKMELYDVKAIADNLINQPELLRVTYDHDDTKAKVTQYNTRYSERPKHEKVAEISKPVKKTPKKRTKKAK